MKSPLHSFFKSLPEAELPTGLSERIFSEIGRVREREIRRTILFSRIRVVVSGVVACIALFFAGSAVLGSEFVQLFSLVVSDTLVLTAYGGELFWLFLETFPAIPFMLFLIPLFLFLLSLGMHAMVLRSHPGFPRFLAV